MIMSASNFHFFSGGKFTARTNYPHIGYVINIPYRLIFWLAYWLRLPPEVLVVCNLIFAILSAVQILHTHWFLALLFFYIADLCDASDGALARYTNQVSRRGRFLDTHADILSIALLHIAVGIVVTREATPALAITLPLASAMLMIWEGSWQHYFSFQYAQRVKNQTNIRTDEREMDVAAAPLERVLQRLYVVTLAWQDRLVMQIDHWLTQGASEAAQEKAFVHKPLLFWNSFFLFRFPLYIILVAALMVGPFNALIIYLITFSIALSVFHIYRITIVKTYEKTTRLS
jgi:phosphatidylglycerophosphate synthase